MELGARPRTATGLWGVGPPGDPTPEPRLVMRTALDGAPREFLTWAGFPEEVTAELRSGVQDWFNEDRVGVSLIDLQRDVISKLAPRAEMNFHHISEPFCFFET